MNNQEENYNFCPRCGALMEDGICPECSKNREQGVYSSQNFPKEPPQQDYNQADAGYGQQNWQDDRQEQYYEQQDPYRNAQYGQQNPYYGGQNPYPGQQNPYYGGQDPYRNAQYGQQNPYYGGQNPYPGGQNPYYGGQGPYPGQNYGSYPPYNPYMQPKKDNRVAIAIGIVAAVLILLVLIICSYYYGYFLTKVASENMGSSDWEEYYDSYGSDESRGSERDDRDGGDSYDDIYGEEDYVPSADDTYYYGPCDAINEDVDYSFVTKSYTNEDPDNDIDVVVNYLEIKGDNIPNVDRLNEAIEDVALYYAVDFPQYSYYAEYGERFAVYTTTYVTYNDADMISIVLDEYVIVDDEYHVDLYPINIDVKNGVVLDNGSLLQIDEEFAREFRERNDEQNGSIDYLDSLTDEELANALRDKQAVIAYYTPLGMEVGLNYNTSSSTGWVTVTYKDYEKYLMKF